METLKLACGLLAYGQTNGGWEYQHIARNIFLDCNFTCFAHPDSSTCGKRLDASQVALLDSLIGANQADIDLCLDNNDIDGLDKLLEKIAIEAKKRISFGSKLSDANNDDLIVVTYISCVDFANYWLGRPDIKFEEVIVAIDEFFENIKMASSCKDYLLKLFKPAKIPYMKDKDKVVWVTEGDAAPHKSNTISSLTKSSDKAEEIARTMGLADYDNEDKRKDKVGLMAVTYKIPADKLFIPNVISSFFGPYFFPGYITDDHGCVASLYPSHGSPYFRDTSSSCIPEWVHDNVPIVEYELVVEPVGIFK